MLIIIDIDKQGSQNGTMIFNTLDNTTEWQNLVKFLAPAEQLCMRTPLIKLWEPKKIFHINKLWIFLNSDSSLYHMYSIHIILYWYLKGKRLNDRGIDETKQNYTYFRYQKNIWKLVKIFWHSLFFTKWILIMTLYSNFDFT